MQLIERLKQVIKVPKNLESLLSQDVFTDYAEATSARNSQQLQVYLDEASFFFPHLRENIGVSPNTKILEVGSGSGLLSLLMSEAGGDVVSVEPFSAGFERLEEFHSVILLAWQGQRKLPSFRTDSVQDLLAEKKKFDLVVAIHVIEHVPDWRGMLDSMVSLLKESGKIIVICPNYSFPYEQHLEVPIVLGKRLTWFLFHKKIRDSHKVDNIKGFWQDLSWPTAREIGSFLKSRGLSFRFSRKLLQSYFGRLADPHFLERKGPLFRGLARFAPMVKTLSFFVPKRWLPLVDVEISRKRIDGSK